MTKPTVLLTGVTGMFGFKVAMAIASKGAMSVRALVRADNLTDSKKAQTLDSLKAQGIKFVEGDLLNPASLPNACEGIDAIVSAVSGDDNIVVTGQINLIEAAQTKGVKRMIHSDFSFDYRKLDWGDNYNSDMRKKVFHALEESSIAYTLILNGCFTEILFSPFLNVFDFKAGQFNYWGDGETLIDFTTTDDTAKYIAEAIADPEMENAALEVAGDVLSMKQLKATYSETTGKTLIENHLGSVTDLQAWIANAKTTASSPDEYLAQQYLFGMVSGKAKLDHIDNQRYPNITHTSVKEYILKAGL
ncbi:MAG: NmrA family NAD(P)-binding protein [Rhizonema sp. PD38]|nr:NmrA family NAD(P)-binding protein [Rhizonema sp. PD38]